MTRAVVLAWLAISAASAQTLTPDEQSEGFSVLFNGRDLTGWRGDPQHWKAGQGTLTGSSGGIEAFPLILDGPELSDFELRLELRVQLGSGRVRMRAPGAGPLGVELSAGTSSVQWFVNGLLFTTVASVKPGEWNAYRIICQGGRFDVLLNDRNTAYTIAASHHPSQGRLALLMPQGEPCAIELRKIRLKTLPAN